MSNRLYNFKTHILTSKLTCRDMDATVVFLDLEELWMGSTGDTILAFGCCYVHFCFIVVVIGYIIPLVNVIVIVAVTAIGYKNSVVIWLSNRCCKMHDWCYTTTSCMFLQVCLHFIFLKLIFLLKLICKLLFNSKIQLGN